MHGMRLFMDSHLKSVVIGSASSLGWPWGAVWRKRSGRVVRLLPLRRFTFLGVSPPKSLSVSAPRAFTPISRRPVRGLRLAERPRQSAQQRP